MPPSAIAQSAGDGRLHRLPSHDRSCCVQQATRPPPACQEG